MQIIRKSSLRPVPWKNGGGITHEMIRVPAAGAAFLWRVSIAQIDASGPFSSFAGYRRKMVLLRGAGVRLTVAAGPDRHLREIGDMTEFDGGVATDCELVGGPCTDLNLMISASLTGARAWVERLSATRPLEQPPVHGVVLAFAISGTVTVELEHRKPARLQEWDLAVISSRERGSIGPAAPDSTSLDGAAAPLVFFATLDDNSLPEP